MRPFELQSANTVDLAHVAHVLAEAFGDGSRGKQEWRLLLQRELESGRASQELSSVAVANHEIVGACIVNAGPAGFARIGPTGVRLASRRQGVGRALVRHCVSRLDAAGAKSTSLEVAKDNCAARALYGSAGFEDGRHLSVYVGRQSDLQLPANDVAVVPLEPDQAINSAALFHDHAPAYQRRPFYTRTFRTGVHGFGALRRGKLVGAMALRGQDILDVSAEGSQHDIVAALVWAGGEVAREQRLINVPSDDPVGEVLVDLGFQVESNALEMVRST